jgi:hypothetical protein
MDIFLGIFLILHGLVHGLYASQSMRWFELKPGLRWPDDSWLLSKLLGDDSARSVATLALALTTLGFLSAGLGLFLRQDWWRPVAIGAAILSCLIYIVFWDGSFKAWDAKGGIGLLINLAILAIIFFLK